MGSLKKGTIKTSKNTPHTILVVGEAGVGKSSVLEFIANVLAGNDTDHYDFDILDHTNEHCGSHNRNESQTNSVRLYQLTSKNGTVVRILDTPGFLDTRGLQQNERYNEGIVTQIKEHIDSVTAILVLANGTVPGITVATNSALSALSALLPKTLANSIALMLTNLSGPLYQNVSVPDVLKDAPQFSFNNPVALQKKYIKLTNNLKPKNKRTDMRKMVKADEQKALEMLVELFDWLGGD